MVLDWGATKLRKVMKECPDSEKVGNHCFKGWTSGLLRVKIGVWLFMYKSLKQEIVPPPQKRKS